MTTVRDLMTRDVTTVSRTETVDVVYERMLDQQVRHMPVVDDQDELAGIISHRDIAALLGRYSQESFATQAHTLATVTAEACMSRGLATVEPDSDLKDAAELMLEHKLGCLPVCEGAHIVGILTEADFVWHVAQGG